MKIIRILAAACFALSMAAPAEASKLYIREYSSVGFVTALSGDPVPIAKEPGTDQPVVDFSGGVALSAAFASTTRFVRIICDAQCSFKVGTNPTNATNANAPMGAMQSEFIGVSAGDKISVIANP